MNKARTCRGQMHNEEIHPGPGSGEAHGRQDNGVPDDNEREQNAQERQLLVLQNNKHFEY